MVYFLRQYIKEDYQMAKLYFRYGSMNSGKTANLLMVADNYQRQGRSVLILKPDKDTRGGLAGEVKSRAIEDPFSATLVGDEDDLFHLVKAKQEGNDRLAAVLVEEAQFLLPGQVQQLTDVVDKLRLPVMAYGLRGSYQPGKLFPGSAALLYWADSIEEIKNVCPLCTAKATMNLLTVNGKAISEGSQVVMGDVDGADIAEQVYTPMCRFHYKEAHKKAREA
jgi:thymidine kinase